jgi:ATP-binding cassette subfamily B protein
MFKMIRQFTFDNPKEIIWPTVWLFISQAFSVIPSILAFIAIYALGSAFAPPYELEYTLIIKLSVASLICFVLHYVVEVLSYNQTYYRAYRDTADKRIRYIQKLRAQNLGFFHSKESGELISSFATDFANVEFTMCYWLPYPIGVGILLILSFFWIAFYNWQMALAMFALFPVCGLMMYFSSKIKARHSKSVLDAKTKAATQVNEYLHGMKDLKAYNLTGKGFKSLEQAFDTLRRETIKDEVMAGSLSSICGMLIHFLVPITVVLGIYYILGGSLTVVDFAAFLILATKLSDPALMVVTCLGELRSMALSGKRLHKVMTTENPSGDKTIKYSDEYQFNNVEFAYKKDENILNKVSFTTPKSEVTALVGPSGSGKSTIVRLMARFWDNQKGNISVENHDIRDIKTDSLLSQISMVMQNPYLFRGSFRDNLCFGNEGITEEQMVEACEKAHCHQFITALPEGYDTIIGEGGATLSGGERQRISLARAFLKDVPILLLDEPTASLDADNEKAVQEALDEISKEKTVIMIAHRLKTIRSSKQILVIDNGEITEQGTHEELIKNNWLYAKMWNLQSKAANFTFK